MLYEYKCKKCNEIIEMDFTFGAPAKAIDCECGGIAQRHFGSCIFMLKGNDWPRKNSLFKKEMTEKNARAGRCMGKEWGDQPRLVKEQ